MSPWLAKGSPEIISGTRGPWVKRSSSPAMSPQLSTMQPRLLLVLTLLGMVSALCSEETLSLPSGPSHAMEVPACREKGSGRYFAVVKERYTYGAAQRYCQNVYKGQLASVHSAAANEQLRKLAATYTHWSLWIGAVTTCKMGFGEVEPASCGAPSFVSTESARRPCHGSPVPRNLQWPMSLSQ
ncbi:hypothetical protein CIB84_016248 [Bambusicola thoracicus]|uniref:Link domain-containing protein n=1 Tax=Bambusicola thoracicus TaxID=9083 RepID=A0A2P4S7C1_BAMTH|nr:hypothetical protein CIB84_016248 [Bambusicola thoracicus]